MIKKLLLVGGLAIVLALGLIAGGGTPTKAFVAPGIQDFNLDLVNCLVPAYPDAVSPNPEAGYPQVCAAGEDKTVSGSVGYSTAIGLIAGNRQGFPYVYSGPGWVLQSDGATPDGTTVGDVASTIDIYADGYKDVLGNASNCGGPPNNCATPLTLPTTAPEDYVKQTLAWGATTGCDGTDETFLNDILPGASAMTPYVRYRACLTTLFLQGKYRLDIKAVNGVTTPLNLVNLAPVWSPAGTYVNLISLGGEAASPTTGLLTQDTPQASISHTDSPYAKNPAAAGLYVRWMTEISAEDAADRAINFVYSTSCKAIGGNFTDADGDCLATVANGGGPADTNDANPDQDNDGLLDGVEVAWGSNPLLADTDGDGRTDAEEMVGPTQFLTNPKVADTDADTVPDGGLTLDANGDGVPDLPDMDGNGIADAGMSANLDLSGDGSSHRRVGYRIVGWDIKPDGAGTDNCPSIKNGASEDNQANYDLDSATTLGNGDLYGDACDSDDENDNFPDSAEPYFQWDAGAHSCGNDKDLPGPAQPLSLHNSDTDGDGLLDGSECWAGSNPADAGDTPGAAAAGTDPDKDALNNAMETDRRTEGFSDQPAPALVGDEDVDGDTLLGKSDSDSDGDGLSDGCEAFVTGTSPMRVNSDSIGQPDNLEPNLQDKIAAYCTPKAALWDTPITRNLPGAIADGVKLTFTIPVGTRIWLVAAGVPVGTSSCPWRAALPPLLGPPTWTVLWGTNKCIADGQSVSVQVNYIGMLPPTLTGIVWVDPGTDIGSDLGGPWPSTAGVGGTPTDLDGDLVLNDVDNCPWVPNLDQANTNPEYGNGKGIALNDKTVPWSVRDDKKGDACDGDLDNDGILNGVDPNPSGDITYDDNNDGTWKGAGDDGPSWDDNMNAKLDGREALCPSGVPTTDTDKDGLTDRMEYCKWGSSPIKVDSDGDTKGDCVEVVDTNGDGAANLTDVVNAAKAALLAEAAFGRDGDFDINGDNAVNLTDVTQIAKFALIAGTCK